MEEITGAFLGLQVRKLREARGLTQEEFSARADVHVTWISGVECGKRNPGWRHVQRMARGLDLSPTELVAEVERSHLAQGGG